MNTPTLIQNDIWLKPFESAIISQQERFKDKLDEIEQFSGNLKNFASRHHFFGLHQSSEGWIFREWAPNATSIFLTGDFTNWQLLDTFKLNRLEEGIWEIHLPLKAIKHGDKFKLHIFWEGGDGYRLPSYANRVIQDNETLVYDAQVWAPPANHVWMDQSFQPTSDMPIIYEAHIGMSSEEEKVTSFQEFTKNTLPRIKELGYNTIQLMAVQEHPYYGSFGYHVSNFFAVSSRFGTPEELKQLIDTAHQMGLTVIMDIVHSHSVRNELEGLSLFDGKDDLYFYGGEKGLHPAWDSRCFNYEKMEVLQFLLSNCAYWLEEFHFDGYRFDGVTSMLYHDHGLGKNFVEYADYFSGATDPHALTYLTLANYLIHHLKPSALSIAEEMSGYPGIAGKIEAGGIGFDYRLSMGIPDFWIKLIKEQADENWNVAQIYHELSQHRIEEKTISYAESHDQALVGDKTIIFRLAEKDMYEKMATHTPSIKVDRAIALHKIIRLITIGTSPGGYLNFMGNEFGHPEWIDFPREGNNNSYKYARRQWSLADHPHLKYQYLQAFDKSMIQLVHATNFMASPNYKHLAREEDQVLAFSRGDYLFVFNFSPDRSYTDYGIPASAGKYQLVLCTDQPEFGGFDRVDMNHMYYTQQLPLDAKQHQLMLYLPARTGSVFKKQHIRSVH